MAMADPNPRRPHPDNTITRMAPNVPVLGERQRVYLLPGELHATAEPCQISTILGSCVAICLWDRRLHAGGMNHFLLPASRKGERTSLRFADVATKALLEKLQLLGCRLPNLQAKIFGGSAMFQNENSRAISLGAQNVAVALDLMKNAGIPVIAQETGGNQGRRIVFNADDGMAWSRQIGNGKQNNGF
jgi:chemotaxis protein CheD